MNIIDEMKAKVIEIFQSRKTPSACEFYMSPRVAIDPVRKLALVIEEYQEVHSGALQMLEIRYRVVLYDIEKDSVQHINSLNVKAGPSMVSDSGNYESTELNVTYDAEKGELCFTTEKKSFIRDESIEVPLFQENWSSKLKEIKSEKNEQFF